MRKIKSLSFPPEMADRLEREAKERKCSISKRVREALLLLWQLETRQEGQYERQGV